MPSSGGHLSGSLEVEVLSPSLYAVWGRAVIDVAVIGLAVMAGISLLLLLACLPGSGIYAGLGVARYRYRHAH